jgi:hypothetical protein
MFETLLALLGSTLRLALLKGYFGSAREAFDDRSIRRGIVVAEGTHLACQT